MTRHRPRRPRRLLPPGTARIPSWIAPPIPILLRPDFLVVPLAVLLLSARPALAESPPPISFGGEIRLRGEAFDNLLDLDSSQDDSYNFYRMRYRLWTDAHPREGLRIYLRLGNEYRWGSYEKAIRSDGLVTEAASIRDPESRVSLDNGFVELRGPERSGLTFKFGRMDLFYGEGFLIFDGTPADGSSSAYFDAIALNWRGGPSTPFSADLFTAKIQDEGFGTPARDENLYGLYTHGGPVDLYLLHRTKWGTTVNGPERIVHPRQYTTALGGRFAHLPATGPRLAFEGAAETGRYYDGDLRCGCGAAGSHDRVGYGGYAHGGWVSPGRFHPGLEAGGLYLSGDDPTTGRYEGWDGFYSEWPKWSELYVYTLYDGTTRISPDDAGTWTNLVSAWIEGRANPLSGARASARVALFRAVHATGPGAGKDRGLLLAGQIDLSPMPGVEMQLLGETFQPGDFYKHRAQGRSLMDSRAWYGRWQVTARY